MGRKAILLLTSLAVMVVVSAGLALAAAITGTRGPDTLSGTQNADKIAGSAKGDIISGKAGNDQLFGDSGNDNVNGGAGADNVQSGTGIDSANGQDGAGDFVSVVDNDTNDTAIGGAGSNDTCVVDQIGMQRDDFTASCERVLVTEEIP
jgi:Ca2+-binding RTX toxin-like protein